MSYASRVFIALLLVVFALADGIEAQLVVAVRGPAGRINVRPVPPHLTRTFRTGSRAARTTAARSLLRANETVRDMAVIDLSARSTQRRFQFYRPTPPTPSEPARDVLTEVAQPTPPDRELFITIARWSTEEAPWAHLFTYREGESVLAYLNRTGALQGEWKVFDPVRTISLDDLVRGPNPVAVGGVGIPVGVAKAWSSRPDRPFTFITPSSPYYESPRFTYAEPRSSVSPSSVTVFDFLPRLGTDAELVRMGLPVETEAGGERVALAPIWRMARADIDLIYQNAITARGNKTDLLRTLGTASDNAVIIIIAHSAGADIRLPDGSILTLDELRNVRLPQPPARAAFVISCSQAASTFESTSTVRLASSLIENRLASRVYARVTPMSVRDAVKFLRDVKAGTYDDAALAQQYGMSTNRD